MESSEDYRIWPLLSKEENRDYTNSKYITRREYLNKLKSRPCLDCGASYPPYVMDFDHVVGDKLTEVGALIMAPWKVLRKEIAKCEVVCSNCHRERTNQRRLSVDMVDLPEDQGANPES